MKWISIGALLIGVFSCDSKTNSSIEATTIRTDERVISNNKFNIVVIDSCEYVYFAFDGGHDGAGGICHKGNCKNH